MLSGRYVTIHILPLSFKEYLTFCEKDVDSLSYADKEVLFNDFIHIGQFPYISSLNNDEQEIKSYLEGIYNTILIKDVCTRNKITDVSLIQRIVKTLCSNIGSPISTKRITDTLISSGQKISGTTVSAYIHSLCDGFIFYLVFRYDIKGNELLKTLGKFYMADTSFRNVLLGIKNDDFGHIIENIVYLELLRRENNVFIGKYENAEINFIAKNQQKICYYQICASIVDEQTRQQEIAPLLNIEDNYPKYLISLDKIHFDNLDGIIHVNLIDWLLE